MDDSDRAKADQKWIRNELRAKRLADYYSRHIDAEILEPMQRNFEVDSGREDSEAKRRSTRTEVHHELIKGAFYAYMHSVPKFRRKTTLAVRAIKAAWKEHFHIDMDERTIYEILRPSSRSRRRTKK
jgi:hypothetical protein